MLHPDREARVDCDDLIKLLGKLQKNQDRALNKDPGWDPQFPSFALQKIDKRLAEAPVDGYA